MEEGQAKSMIDYLVFTENLAQEIKSVQTIKQAEIMANRRLVRPIWNTEHPVGEENIEKEYIYQKQTHRVSKTRK